MVDHFSQIGCAAGDSNWQLVLSQATSAPQVWCIGWLWSICCCYLSLQHTVWNHWWKLERLSLDLMD